MESKETQLTKLLEEKSLVEIIRNSTSTFSKPFRTNEEKISEIKKATSKFELTEEYFLIINSNKDCKLYQPNLELYIELQPIEGGVNDISRALSNYKGHVAIVNDYKDQEKRTFELDQKFVKGNLIYDKTILDEEKYKNNTLRLIEENNPVNIKNLKEKSL